MADTYTATGTVKVIGETQSFGSKGFKKRQIVIETSGDYPKTVAFDFTKDKTDVLDNFQEGDKVEIAFDIGGREWNGRYFTELTGWKITKTGGGGNSSTRSNSKSYANRPSTQAPRRQAPPRPAPDEFDEDSPF